jgi:hypothetical protein
LHPCFYRNLYVRVKLRFCAFHFCFVVFSCKKLKLC